MASSFPCKALRGLFQRKVVSNASRSSSPSPSLQAQHLTKWINTLTPASTRTLDNNHGNNHHHVSPSSHLSQKSHHPLTKGGLGPSGVIISSRHKSSSSSSSSSSLIQTKSTLASNGQQNVLLSASVSSSPPCLILPPYACASSSSSGGGPSASSSPSSSSASSSSSGNRGDNNSSRGFSTGSGPLLQSPSVHQVSTNSSSVKSSQQQELVTSSSSSSASSSDRHPLESSESDENDQESGDDGLKVDPFKLVESDLNNLYQEIRRELWTQRPELEEIAGYYFDGQGKAFRPMIVVLVARALNYHVNRVPDLIESQKTVAMVAEMIHTASLVHDDVIDTADTRRGKASVNVLWGQKKAILAGDYIISRASQMLARLRNDDVIFALSQVLLDLVQGEFMQMGSKEDESERFSHYIHKSFKKTASLIAYTCKAVGLLSGANQSFQEAAFQYGRNLGIAFQLVDDLLDFVSSQAELGKPAATDLKLGLATAPVLFACEKFPELNVMIMRRFSEPGDVERAYDYVMKSDGLDHTRILARKHADEALRHISPFAHSLEKEALCLLAEMTLNRKK